MAVVQTAVSNAEIIDRFLDAVWQEAGLRENTLSAYRNDLAQFSKWLSNRQPYLLKASRSDVLAYLAASVKRGISAKSSARRLSTLRRFYRHLLRETLIDVDPTSEIASPVTGRPLPISLSEDAVTQLLEAPNAGTALGLRDRAMIELLYASGLRVSEACGLRLQDVRSDQGIIHCTGKCNRERIVPTSKTCLNAIESYRLKERPRLLREDGEELLFLSRSGQRLGREVIAAMVRKYALLAGISKKVTPHTLRHSLATHLLRGRADLRIVQEILGHVNVETTELYTHIEKSELKKLHAEFHPRG